MVNVLRTAETEEPVRLPRGLIYGRLKDGLNHGHDGWAFTSADFDRDGIEGDPVATLGRALGNRWSVWQADVEDIHVERRDNVERARVAVEVAFPPR